MSSRQTVLRFRLAILLFMMGLVASGFTAFPLLKELDSALRALGYPNNPEPELRPGLEYWLLTVRRGLQEMYGRYPWMAYGTDWLAFGHFVVALFFVGPLWRPRESRPLLLSGVAACLLVVPMAIVAGGFRGIPFYWRLVDCAFGLVGVLPLLYCLMLLKYLESKEGEAADGAALKAVEPESPQ